MKALINILYLIPVCLLMLASSCDNNAPFSDDEIITGWEYVQGKIDSSLIVDITGISPQGVEAATATEFTIYGENFQTSIDSVRVFFGSTEVKIISLSETEITVYRPNVSDDSVQVKVACHDRLNVAHYGPIWMASVINDYGNFTTTEQIKDFTISADSTIYMFLAGDVNSLIKFDYPAESRSDWTGDLTGTYGFYMPIEIKANVDGSILYTSNVQVLLRCGANGADYMSNRIDYLSQSLDVQSREFDFAENDDIYVGGIDIGIYRVTQAGNVSHYDLYAGYSIRAVRIFDGEMYVIAKPLGDSGQYGIYKNAINNDGSLSATVQVLNWEGTRVNSSYDLNDITFDSDGELYLASSDPQSPLMKLESGELSTVYYGIIPSPVNELEWGPGNELFILTKITRTYSGGNKIYRVNLGKAGAPYYGRE